VSRQLRFRAAVLGGAALAAALTACSGGSGPAADSAAGGGTTIRMVQEWPVADAFWIPWIVARDNGYYRAAGINLQIIPPPNTSATAQYVGTGRADLAFDTSMDVVFARAQDAPMVSIAAYGSANNWGLISSNAKPLDFAQIKGKTIGTYNDSKAQLQIMLHSVGLTLSDVKLVTASSDTVPLLLQHKVDAITGVTNAEGSELASEGMPDYSIALAKDHSVPDSPVWVLAANSAWLAKNKPLAQKFMTATLKGWQYAIDHPATAVSDFEHDYPKAETKAFATIQWKDTSALFGSTVTAQTLRQSDANWSALLQAAKKYGVVSKTEAPSAYYTNELLGQ
jgi:putative hydroxymethylpyrimidine transport system substrate-binding protein